MYNELSTYIVYLSGVSPFFTMLHCICDASLYGYVISATLDVPICALEVLIVAEHLFDA